MSATRHPSRSASTGGIPACSRTSPPSKVTLTIRRGPNRRTREVRPITPVDAVASVHGETSIEGTFLLCTFLLVRVMADRGRITQARAVFKNAQSHVNDVGRLAEEIDSATGEQLGNFPQAFSHVILVNAAWSI